MKPFLTLAICSIIGLSACGEGNPFMEDVVAPPTTPTPPAAPVTDGGFEVGGGGVPPGVDGPNGTPEQRIVRFEERNESGGGFAEEFSYNSVADTFTVDNLAFDGENVYSRGTAVASLGLNDAYAVYDAAITVPDFLNGQPIPQIRNYRAIVGISARQVNGLPRTSFAIVRTGGFRDFGFGGFVYQREGGVVMPARGQAVYTGDYAGVRIFSGPDGTLGGLEFTEADMRMEIDFDDPNIGNGGVKGSVFNRIAYDINGVLVPLGNDGDANQLPLPNVDFVLDGIKGNLNADGEMTGGLISSYTDPDGNTAVYETGTYYAILAGDTTAAADGGEIVGVMVLDSTDPRFEGVTAQETGGFILLR